MRAVVQRVTQASVTVDGKTINRIGCGLLVYAGIHHNDTQKDIDYITNKIIHLRVFPDCSGKMNRSILETKGQIMVVSQFTLYGDVRRGRRPTYHESANAEHAAEYINTLIESLQQYCPEVYSGIFQAHMMIDSCNDGPVTILLDSAKQF